MVACDRHWWTGYMPRCFLKSQQAGDEVCILLPFSGKTRAFERGHTRRIQSNMVLVRDTMLGKLLTSQACGDLRKPDTYPWINRVDLK